MINNNRPANGQEITMTTQTIAHEFPLADTPATALPTPPHGHVMGHPIGERTIESFAGRPHGMVVGHAVGQPLTESFAGRPHGMVVGHAISQATSGSFVSRPRLRVADGHTDEAPASTAKPLSRAAA
jgi:hypothetical protein